MIKTVGPSLWRKKIVLLVCWCMIVDYDNYFLFRAGALVPQQQQPQQQQQKQQQWISQSTIKKRITSCSQKTTSESLLLISPCSNLKSPSSRRTLFSSFFGIEFVSAAATIFNHPLYAFADTESSVNVSPPTTSPTSWSDVTVVITNPEEKIGLELFNVVIGSNPPIKTVAIKQVVFPNNRNQRLQQGMILRDYTDSNQVIEQLKNGPYPVTLVFKNLAGDQANIISAQTALRLAQEQAINDSTTRSNSSGSSSSRNIYIKTTLEYPSVCKIQSRRDDVLEIIYQAHIDSPQGPIYDASKFRGTGRPYQMVLGSGDMLPGVDQGLYDMCPGEVRGIQIPPQLAYGSRGNKLFRIPPETYLYWQVELVSVNMITKDDERSLEEIAEINFR